MPEFSIFITFCDISGLSIFNTIIRDTKYVDQRFLAVGVNILLFSNALICKREREHSFTDSPVQCSNNGICWKIPELNNTSHCFKWSSYVPRTFTWSMKNGSFPGTETEMEARLKWSSGIFWVSSSNWGKKILSFVYNVSILEVRILIHHLRGWHRPSSKLFKKTRLL